MKQLLFVVDGHLRQLIEMINNLAACFSDQIPVLDLADVQIRIPEQPRTVCFHRTHMVGVLMSDEDVPDGMAKLRTVYPNLMQLVYDNSRTRQSRQVEVTEHVEQKSEMELFEEFYEIQNNQPMSEEQQDFVRELMEELVH